VHEHQRNDRDDNIKVNLESILVGVRSYDKMNLTNYGQPYDLSSVMHYGNTNLPVLTALDSFRNNLMGQRQSLSYLDIKLANLAYNCSGTRTEFFLSDLILLRILILKKNVRVS
jgi:hypothetical protein